MGVENACFSRAVYMANFHLHFISIPFHSKALIAVPLSRRRNFLPAMDRNGRTESLMYIFGKWGEMRVGLWDSTA